MNLFSNDEEYQDFIQYVKMRNNLWNIINATVFYISKITEQFYIIIDQYCSSFDSNGSLKLIILQKIKNIKIIVCSSINEYEIKDVLIKKWKNLLSVYDFDYYYVPYLIDDNSLNKSGKIKYLDLFNYLPQFKYSLEEKEDDEERASFVEDEMIKISKEIESFYQRIDTTNYLNNYRRCYYSTNLELDKQKFFDVIKYVPLKYFRIEIINELIPKYKITFHYPLIEQIYRSFIIPS